jgi:hypothetical protein
MIKYIPPKDILNFEENEIIIVDRVRINSKLVRLEFQGSEQKECIAILRKAINDMIIQEKIAKKTFVGAKMAVRDVKKVFSEVHTMPSNSFFTLE